MDRNVVESRNLIRELKGILEEPGKRYILVNVDPCTMSVENAFIILKTVQTEPQPP